MKILITGGCGFLGGETKRQLESAGHQVLTADKRGAPDYAGDLAEAGVAAALPEADVVIHCAAAQYVSEDLPVFGRRDFFARNNVEVTRRVVERYAGTRAHFINISTSMVYHQSGRAVYDVSSPKKPQGHYSASKILCQALVDQMPNRKAVVVPCIIAGEGRAGLFEYLVVSMLRGRRVIIPGTGAHPIHLVHVRDCAALIKCVAESGAEGAFNAANPEPLSINQWMEEIRDELGLAPAKRLYLPLAPIWLASALLGYIPAPQERLLMLKYPHVLSIEEGRRIGWTPGPTNAAIVRETARAIAGRAAP